MPKVELYTKATCGYCMMAKRMLDRKGVEYTEYPVGSDAPKFDEMISRSQGGRTVPQIFINDMHVGGFDELNGLERAGNLDPLLKS